MKTGRTKRLKPVPDFPLSANASGQWQKKIRGKVFVFGRWGRMVDRKVKPFPPSEFEAEWKSALAEYQRRLPNILLGKEDDPEEKPVAKGELRLHRLCDEFIAFKRRELRRGTIVQGTFDGYHLTCNWLCSDKDRRTIPVSEINGKFFRQLRDEMEDVKKWGVKKIKLEISKVHILFNWAYAEELIDRPVRYGSDFKKPGSKELGRDRERHERKHGKKLLEAAEVRKALDATRNVDERAELLLALNCAFYGSDCSHLPLDAVDLKKGWITFPRPKSTQPRRCKLWPETVEALKEVLAKRPKPQAGFEHHVFLRADGRPHLTPKGVTTLGKWVSRMFKKVGIHRKGIGISVLRHTFRTQADNARDPVATNLIMGHADGTQGATYTHGILDSRLEAVADVVHDWLWPPKKKK